MPTCQELLVSGAAAMFGPYFQNCGAKARKEAVDVGAAPPTLLSDVGSDVGCGREEDHQFLGINSEEYIQHDGGRKLTNLRQNTAAWEAEGL